PLTRPAVARWNPVGVAYAGGLVFVANGSGGDIVVARIAGGALELVRRITNPGLQDPQSVAAGGDGSLAAVDERGNSVLLFDQGGTLRWRVSVRGAHAVTTTGGRVYVSS